MGGGTGGGAPGNARGHGLGSGATQRDHATGQGLGALSSPNSLHVHAHKATVWVVRYVDYTSKYGLGFLLNTGSAGVYFNDSTKVQGLDLGQGLGLSVMYNLLYTPLFSLLNIAKSRLSLDGCIVGA